MAALDVIDDVQDGDTPDALWRTWGMPTATNIATLLLFLSEEALCRIGNCQVDAFTARAIVELYACHGVRSCIGQQRDLDAVGSRVIDEEAYLAMIGMKSGALVSCICRGAAMLGSRDLHEINAFAEAGLNLGMLLQILNDVAGITGTADERSDLTVWKWTLPLIFAFDAAGPSVRSELQALLSARDNASLTAPQLDRLREIVANCGAIHYARVVGDVYWERMGTALHEVPQGRAQPMIDFVTSLHDAV